MKKLITFIVCLLISISSFAQIGINYKAVIKDDQGNVISNQEIDMRFSLEFDAGIEFGIITIYQELHTVTTTNNGIVILNIGEGTVISGTFPQDGWNSSDYMIIEVDLEQDGTFINLGTTDFKMVPMALSARHAEFAITANSANNVSGLERITESTGSETGLPIYGWRLIGRNSGLYGDIGRDAVDLSTSNTNLEVKGATGSYSTAMGYQTHASGIYSTVMGLYTTAPSFAEIVVGHFNTNYTPNGITFLDNNDRLFVIGNGSFSARNNALTVLKNGKTGINTSDPQSLFEVAHQNGGPTPSNLTNAISIKNSNSDKSWQFHVNSLGALVLYRNGLYTSYFHETSGAYVTVSDRRLKKDITSLEKGTLNKVMQLNPVSYLMKDQTDTKRNLGLISQEVQELFPSITHYVKDSDVLSLSYTELIPVLIKALQEQQAIIEQQNAQIETLSTDNSLLKEKDDTQDKSIEALVSRLNLLESKSSH